MIPLVIYRDIFPLKEKGILETEVRAYLFAPGSLHKLSLRRVQNKEVVTGNYADGVAARPQDHPDRKQGAVACRGPESFWGGNQTMFEFCPRWAAWGRGYAGPTGSLQHMTHVLTGYDPRAMKRTTRVQITASGGRGAENIACICEDLSMNCAMYGLATCLGPFLTTPFS